MLTHPAYNIPSFDKSLQPIEKPGNFTDGASLITLASTTVSLRSEVNGISSVTSAAHEASMPIVRQIRD